MKTSSATVLIVDDNASIRQLARIALERAGHSVRESADGLDAAHLLQTMPFDVVVTDLDMPKRSGLELLVDVRRLQPSAGAVLMSGEWHIGLTDVRGLAVEIGVGCFLTKPFALQALREVVSAAGSQENSRRVAYVD